MEIDTYNLASCFRRASSGAVSPPVTATLERSSVVKLSINFLRVVVLGMLVGFCAISAHADSVQDPKVIIRDPACLPPGCTPVGTNFTFGTPTGGTGALFFTNASGVNWFNLQLVESGVPASAITCITDVF